MAAAVAGRSYEKVVEVGVSLPGVEEEQKALVEEVEAMKVSR